MNDAPPRVSPTAEAVDEEIERILASEAFRKAGRLGALLRYLIAQSRVARPEPLKEYAIGVEALGRPDSFDPKTDAVVRVVAHRLRARLAYYYSTAGRRDPLVILLPVGGYTPSFSHAIDSPDVEATRDIPARDQVSGVGREALDAAATPPAGTRRMTPVARAAAAAVAVVLLGAAFTAWRLSAPAGRPVTIVVLPFAAISTSPQDQQLADGLVEELTTALSKRPRLHVIARSAASRFGDQPADLGHVADQLGAAAVIQGSLRRDGQRLRVNVRLVRIPEGYHAWAESYDRDDATLHTLPQEISRRVAVALGVPDSSPSTDAHPRLSGAHSP